MSFISAPFRFFLPGPDETDALAHRIAGTLRPADCLLLSGPVGAGKSHVCRAVIRAMTTPEQEVPSPTYTLMQGYEGTQGAIWHMDLYRLAEPEELMELGVDEMLDDAICLIEWPERLGTLTPARHVHIALAQAGEGRDATIHLVGPGWNALRAELAR